MPWPHINHRAAFDLAQTLSTNVYRRLDEGDRWGIRQGETTISDILLLDLITARLPGITVEKTERAREASDGMDWLLNVDLGGKWVLLAI